MKPFGLRSLRKILAFLAITCATDDALAQEPVVGSIQEVDLRIAEMDREHNGLAVEVLKGLGEPSEPDCGSLEVWAYFQLLSCAQHPDSTMPDAATFEAKWFQQCEPQGYMFPYLLASVEFLQGNYAAAIMRVDAVLEGELPQQVRAEALNIKGVAQMFSNLPEGARSTFDDLAGYGDFLSPQNWNNIAVMFLDHGDVERAQQFIQKGLGHPALGEQDRALLQFNQLLSFTLAEDSSAGSALINASALDTVLQAHESFFLGEENQRRCAEILLDWYLYTDDFDSFEDHEALLKEAWWPSGQAEFDRPIAYHLLLAQDSILGMEWGLSTVQRWKLAQAFEEYGVAQFHPTPRVIVADSKAKSLTRSSRLGWSLVIVLAAACAFLLRKSRSLGAQLKNPAGDNNFLHPGVKPPSDPPAMPTFQTIQSELFAQISDLPDHRQAEIVGTFRRLRSTLWQNKLQDLEMVVDQFGLSGTETRVLELIVAGNSARDIARMLSMSDSYIYNVRARLRERFQIERGVSLEQWVERQIRS